MGPAQLCVTPNHTAEIMSAPRCALVRKTGRDCLTTPQLSPSRFQSREWRISPKLKKDNSNASVAYLLSGKCVLSRGQVRACDAYYGPLRGCRLAPVLCKRCLSRVAEELILCRRKGNERFCQD